ncbi:MAG TPA: NAD-dependent epimerase/dehydratase family protein, partial [Candidatus Limnocylindria bacterium]|nr:NAD-dependent epimerase/dehydratase family protein [Candidatus Limnocylindria bacterium]
MKVLVTGNLGYIGPVLTDALARSGHEVHGYDSALYAAYATRPLPHVARQTIADLRDEKPLRRAIARCDAIVQLAAMSNDPLGELDP